jgi:hypothetical protein
MHPIGRLTRDGVEIAVVALVEAERNMDVKRVHVGRGQFGGNEPVRSETFNQRKHAAMIVAVVGGTD